MMFPDRAPSNVYLYTTFVGGSRNRELAKASRFLKSQFGCSLIYFVPIILNDDVAVDFSSQVNLFNSCIHRTELKDIVTSDLKQLLGAEGEPTYVKYVNS